MSPELASPAWGEGGSVFVAQWNAKSRNGTAGQAESQGPELASTHVSLAVSVGRLVMGITFVLLQLGVAIATFCFVLPFQCTPILLCFARMPRRARWADPGWLADPRPAALRPPPRQERGEGKVKKPRG